MIQHIRMNNFLSPSSFFQSMLFSGIAAAVPRSALCTDGVCGTPSDFAQSAAERVKSCGPTAAEPYLGQTLQMGKDPLQRIPAYVHQFMHPGISYLPKGDVGYTVEEGFYSSKMVMDRHNALMQALQKDPGLRGQMKNLCSDPDGDSKGCAVRAGEIQLLLASSAKMANHKAALSRLRSLARTLDSLSESEIVDEISKAQALLFKNIQGAKTGYRVNNMVVFPDTDEDQDRTHENMMKLVLKRGGTRADIKLIENYYERDSRTAKSPRMSENEKRALSYLGFVPCHHGDVLNEMLRFAKDLKEAVRSMKECENVDPMAIGAFAHRMIGEIHPFGDGNGRIARGLMNAILAERGIDPVVFFKDEDYTAALVKDGRQAGSFRKYIDTVAIPAMKAKEKYLVK